LASFSALTLLVGLSWRVKIVHDVAEERKTAKITQKLEKKIIDMKQN